MYIEYLNNEEIMKELGRRIKDTRIAFNYTQTELAQRAVISKSTIFMNSIHDIFSISFRFHKDKDHFCLFHLK